MVMSEPDDNGANLNSLDKSISQPDPEPSYAPSRHDIRITKNHSTSNLLSHAPRPALSLHVNPTNRYSLDANTAMDFEKMSKSPIIPEHAGEHGLGLSGLRRIRQTPAQMNRGPSPNSGYQTAPTSRSGSIHLTVPLPPSAASVIPSGPSSPILNSIEDLNRFPSESLHSFSFAHQSEDSIDRRQNVLKRSIDFMRDKLGWAASNPGLVAAQARLSGDKEVQSMMELLSRAHIIGEDAEHAHGLGFGGPVTGPADLSGENVFDKSFDFLPAESSTSLVESSESLSSANKLDGLGIDTGPPRRPRLLSAEASITLETLNKVTTDASIDRVVPSQPRTALKRTMTNTDDLSLSKKLADTLAEPYQVHDAQADSMLTPRTLPSIPNPQPIVPAAAVSHMAATPHHGAPHGHGNRWTPAAQAIFTTEASTPWTITSANDLACLVFGVTRSEVRRLGILEVVQPERRKWLEEKLRDPDGGSAKGKNIYSQSQRTSPSSTTALNVGSGITARLLSKPPSRQSAAAKRRSQTDDGSGSGYTQRSKVKGGLNHAAHKSRGVLLCGDVVPIQKRNGAAGAASLWVKEKKGGLIWVLEEIAEDVAFISVDEIGCVTKATGTIEPIWGTDRISKGMDIKRLIPDIPKQTGTYTGVLDYEAIAEAKTYTARTSQKINIPVTISQQLTEETTFRISSFPHIAGIMVLSSQTLKISSSNSVFSAALFGQDQPDGLHINKIIPGFDKVLNLMTDEDKIRLVDGIVIPEHSFRRARAILAMREGKTDAASVFLRPAGLSAQHRDGAEIMVDVQMRVVKSERSTVEEDVIEEVPYEHDENFNSRITQPNTEVVYALWITYSRQLHAANYGVGLISPLLSRPGTPPHQPSPGQTMELPHPGYLEDSTNQSVSLLTKQLKGGITPIPVNGTDSPITSRKTLSINDSREPLRKKAINDFVVLEEMGQGAYGQVKLCRYKYNSGKKVVIKYVTKRRILVDTWTRDRRLGTVPLEIHVLEYLRRDDLVHPNIVEMCDFFEDDVNYYIEMVPHGLPGMDLFDYIELRVNMDEEECRKIFVQVAQAVWHLHIKAKVVHRDIKDENVILDGEGNIKLIDFGSAAYIKNGPFDVFVGTIDYAAPEVLAGQSYRGKEQDVWALGILLYTIIYKENPFYSIDEIMDHDLRVPYVMSDASIDLVRLMLNRDVDQRITIGEVLEHKWCQGEDSEFEGLTPIQ
ncbi:Serine/threonine-protein kinase PSK2 [Venturia nashicola]|uniref:non-specific serine/threonine protein kinase n=1 Tax=Venturia nashicola TaxID=86259 RepID=A0A4Z1PG09_9PEZI|nr:Serine/threonine-protein kinase PSK2 [Venturia nashicola]